jgi:hypothetical protein
MDPELWLYIIPGNRRPQGSKSGSSLTGYASHIGNRPMVGAQENARPTGATAGRCLDEQIGQYWRFE